MKGTSPKLCSVCYTEHTTPHCPHCDTPTRGQMLSYRDWTGLVNKQLISLIGVGRLDVPDQCWRDRYNLGMSVKEAALEGAEQATGELGFDFSEF